MGGRLLDVETYPIGDKNEIEVYKGGIRATQFVLQEPSIETSSDGIQRTLSSQITIIFKLINNPN